MARDNSIVVATDLCENCKAAALYAIEKSQSEGLFLEFVHGSYSPGNPDNLPPEADRLLPEIEATFRDWLVGLGLNPDTVRKHVIQGRNPSSALLHFLSGKEPEAFVMGKTRTGLGGVLFGNRVSKQVIQETQMPITIVG